jgi:hypothetical protein
MTFVISYTFAICPKNLEFQKIRVYLIIRQNNSLQTITFIHEKIVNFNKNKSQTHEQYQKRFY